MSRPVAGRAHPVKRRPGKPLEREVGKPEVGYPARAIVCNTAVRDLCFTKKRGAE